MRDDLGMSNTVAGAITTLPLLAFALLSPFAPKIANKLGMERTIFMSLCVLLIGLITRSLFGMFFLFLGTLLIGLAIAVGNVLIPGYVKMNFPLKIGIVSGYYVVFMIICVLLGSVLCVALSSIGGIGWKGLLVACFVLTIIKLIVWSPQ